MNAKSRIHPKPRTEPLDFDLIDANVARARRMRSEAVHRMLAAAWRGLARPVALRRRRPRPSVDLAHSLAEIRNAAEIMRDTRYLSANERTRLAGVVLQAETRLEDLLAGLVPAPRRIA